MAEQPTFLTPQRWTIALAIALAVQRPARS